MTRSVCSLLLLAVVVSTSSRSVSAAVVFDTTAPKPEAHFAKAASDLIRRSVGAWVDAVHRSASTWSSAGGEFSSAWNGYDAQSSSSQTSSSWDHDEEENGVSSTSSTTYDSRKKAWIYHYESKKEFDQASGPDGYASYRPEMGLPRGKHTKAASSLSYDKDRNVYTVYFTYQTELQSPPS
jgi:hypothetical protein